MNLKFNFFFVAPTPSTIGNCARDIKLALIEARRTNKKIVLLRCYEIFKPLKIKVANKELFNLNSNFILKPNPFYLFQIQLLLTIIFSFVKIISYFKKIFFGRHLAYNYTTPCFGNFKILRGNKKFFSPLTAFDKSWQYDFETEINIDIDDDKKYHAKKVLNKMGLPEGQWFVCLHIRESGYHNDQTLERNGTISNCILAIDYIIKQGGWVIRLGDKSMTKLPKINNVIDYPFTEFKSELLDLYLIKNCKFYIGMTSGIFDVALLFDKPMVIVNSTNWLHGVPPKKNDIVLFKQVYSKNEKKILSNYEWIRKGWRAMHFRSVDKNFQFLENSPQEILRAVKCMFKVNRRYIENQEKFFQSKIHFGTKILSQKIFGYKDSQESFTAIVNNPYHPNANLYDLFVRYTISTVLFVRPLVIKNIKKIF